MGINLLTVSTLFVAKFYLGLVTPESQGSELRFLLALPINSYLTSDRIAGLNNCLDCVLAFSSGRRNESYIAISCHNLRFCKLHQMPKCIDLNDTSMLLGGTETTRVYMASGDVFPTDQRSSLTSHHLALGE